jgi:hypothetical protein
MTISRGQMPRELYQTGTDPEAEKLAKMLNISVLEARRLLNSMEDTSFMQNEKPTMRGGGIASLTQRQQYGLGSIARSITKPFKKAASAVKDFAQSDIGQIALAVAAPYALGPAFASAGLAGSVGGSAFLGNALRAGITNLALQGVTTGKFDLGNAARAGVIGGGITTGLQKSGFMPQGTETDTSSLDSESLDSALRAEQAGNILENPVVDAPTFNEAVALDNALRSEQVVNVPTEISRRTVDQTGSGRNLFSEMFNTSAQASENVPKSKFNLGLDIEEIAAGTTDVSGSYNLPKAKPILGIRDIIKDESLSFPQKISEGAKNLVGLGGGDETLKQLVGDPSLSNLMSFAKNNPELLVASTSLASALTVPQQPEETDSEYLERLALVKDFEDQYGKLAGVSRPDEIEDYETFFSERAGVAMGGMPMGEPKRNAAGIMELDFRDEGGLVPPIGIKEKADDIPAMLSNNEFVFTAEAVRNAGEGDVDKGAKRLYSQMKTLENGGTFA